MENPYWLSLVDPQPAYLARIGAFTAFFVFFFLGVDSLVSAAEDPAVEALSSPRQGGGKDRSARRSGLTAATTACSFFHGVCTSSAAVWVVLELLLGDPSGKAAFVWQWALAFSQGYFIADAALYGTRREAWILIHHGWMVLAHHPIGEPRQGCRLMGVGDCNLAVWLSATGYWAEISTIFLNIRWLQHRWLRKHCVWYTLNSASLLITYPVTRIVAAVAILAGSLWPRMPEYRAQGLSSLVVFTTITYVAMLLMSAYYYATLVSRGWSRALFLRPDATKEG